MKLKLHWQVIICMIIGALIGVVLNPYSDFLKNPHLLKDKDPIEKIYFNTANWNSDLFPNPDPFDSIFIYNEDTCQQEISFDKFELVMLDILVAQKVFSDVDGVKLISRENCLDQYKTIGQNIDCYVGEDKTGTTYVNIQNKNSKVFYYDQNNDDIYQEQDSIYDKWDQFEDVNQNCEYDEPIAYIDINGNGIWDVKEESEVFIDEFDVEKYPLKWHVIDSFEDYSEETINKLEYRLISYVYNFMEFLGTVFVRLLKMIIIPLIFTSIILGVSSIGKGKKLGRLGFKTLLYYVSTSLIAILIGLTLANLIRPGDNLEALSVNSYDASQLQTDGGFADIILRMIPTNPISSLANGEILSIIFFAIIFGIAMNFVNNKYSDNLRFIIESIYKVILKITQFVIKLIPIGVLGLMVKMVTHLGLESLQKLGWYALTIAAGLSIHFFIVLPLILLLFLRRNPIVHYKAMSSAMLTAFSTSSSSATLPVTMKCVNENVKVSNQTSSFVLPMGATINMDGTALYECAGVLFIAQALGIPLDASQQFIVVITALLASIGAAGIPSAGLVMLFIVTNAVGLQSDAVAIWVGSMLAIDRPLDMFRTMVNITSDSVGAAVIAKSEGEKLYD